MRITNKKRARIAKGVTGDKLDKYISKGVNYSTKRGNDLCIRDM